MRGRDEQNPRAYVDLYWIPLGAGGWFVRRNGRLYEALMALRDGRTRHDLNHSALEVSGSLFCSVFV